jgi:D-3-phosphoglycerate dehydrogenase
MRRKVVAFAPNFGWPMNGEGYQRLEAEYVEIPCKTEDEFIEATVDADAVFVPLEPLNRRIIGHMGKCRVISVVGVGFDYVDVKAATEHGICVSNVPDYCEEDMSDHTMALLLSCARKIVLQVVGVKAGEWDSMVTPRIHAKLPPIFRLQGQTLGIVGLGRIGRKVVSKAKGFAMNVIAYDPYLTNNMAQEIGVDLVKLDYLLEKSDFVSLHLPLNDQTRRMFGLDQFKQMKHSAFLINTARGGLVDEEALHIAISKGLIAGAALDVLVSEPPTLDNPLLKLDNILITPHSGFYSIESKTQLLTEAEEEVFRVFGGGWPKNFVNPEVKKNYLRKWGGHKSILED